MLAVVALAVLAGCSGVRQQRDWCKPTAHSPLNPTNLALYLPNRIFDALDVIAIGVQAGPGLHVRVRATGALEAALPISSYGPELGWNVAYPDPIEPGGMGAWLARYRMFGLGSRGGDALPIPLIDIHGGTFDEAPDSIDVGAHVLIVGAHVGVRPVELLDFIVGFAMFDLNRDDLYRPPATNNTR